MYAGTHDGLAVYENGKAIITTGSDKKEIALRPSIAHNFIIGVDELDGVLLGATSKGVSRGEIMRKNAMK